MAHPATVDFMEVQRSQRPADRIALIAQIREGLSYKSVAQAAKSVGVAVKDLADFGVIPARTLAHSKKVGKFTQSQSDRVARFFRIWAQAEATFGTTDKARLWLERPTRPLGNKQPLALLDTEEGARLVEHILNRVDHGLST